MSDDEEVWWVPGNLKCVVCGWIALKIEDIRDAVTITEGHAVCGPHLRLFSSSRFNDALDVARHWRDSGEG